MIYVHCATLEKAAYSKVKHGAQLVSRHEGEHHMCIICSHTLYSELRESSHLTDLITIVLEAIPSPASGVHMLGT